MIASLALGFLLAPQTEPTVPEPNRMLTCPQTSVRYRAERIEDARAVGITFGVRVGTDHDPSGHEGLAHAVSSYLRLHFEHAERATLGLRSSVNRRGTLVRGVVASTEVDRCLEEFGALLAGSTIDPDLAERALAQARMLADDESSVLPGRMLYWRARRSLRAGHPAGRLAVGDERSLEALTPDVLERRLRAVFAPSNAFVVTVGVLDEAKLGELIAEHLGPREPATPLAVVTSAAGDPPEASSDYHRVDAPFVTAAIIAPTWGEADYLPFAIGMVALRTRATRVFGAYRRGESRARFPFVDFNYYAEPGVVVVNRRGRDGDPESLARQEVTGLLADVREHGFTLSEIRAAVQELQQAFMMPPYDDAMRAVLRQNPPALGLRAYTLALLEVFDWPENLPVLLAKVKVRDVNRVVKSAFATPAIHWFSVLPTE